MKLLLFLLVNKVLDKSDTKYAPLGHRNHSNHQRLVACLPGELPGVEYIFYIYNNYSLDSFIPIDSFVSCIYFKKTFGNPYKSLFLILKVMCYIDGISKPLLWLFQLFEKTE